MRTPTQRLFSRLLELGVPVQSLSGGSAGLHIEFDHGVTSEQRRTAFVTIAEWDWSWGVRDGDGGD